MLLTVLILSGTILGATTIAGLLMLYQIRQSADIANSTKAIYAADTGIEKQLYDFFNGGTCAGGPAETGVLDNGAQFSVTCDSQTAPATVNGVSGQQETVTIKATGEAFKNYRSLEETLAQFIPPPPPPPAAP